jgi:hypothetical protein
MEAESASALLLSTLSLVINEKKTDQSPLDNEDGAQRKCELS